MIFQNIANSFHTPTCIISVERKADGYGEIRLVAGNAKYLEPIEHPVFPVMPDMPGVPEVFQTTNKFIPNSLYEKYLPKDIGFEDLCFRCAVKKTPIHTYVHLNDLNIWFDIFALPIQYEDGDICYCVYSTVPSNPEDVGISSSQSGMLSEDVLKTCITLHSTDDLKQTMQEVIQDIRLICRADACTIMLIEEGTARKTVLATSIDESSRVRNAMQFSDFDTISASWLDLVAGSDCLIIKDDRDKEYIRKVDFPWFLNLQEAGVNSFILFPLRYDNKVLGFIWASNFDTTNTMRIKETLELMTFFISSKLSSYKMMEHLKKISYTDRLTSLPNRTACTELVADLIRHGEPFTYVSADINCFKSINDTMGFNTGNQVLMDIATRWKAIVDSGLSGTKDFVARMGGDEFAIVIRESRNADEVLKTIQQYESVLGNRLTVDECDFYITASFGYSAFPEDAATSDSLLSYADAAMCEVKRINSSNRILRFTPDLVKAERTLEIERKLRQALEDDTICYQLQPQYDMNHRLRGFEALARMKDTDGTPISPGEFIPVAEKVGIVDKVDGTVFRKSAMFIGDLIRKTGADIMLSVNVSVRHLMKNDFLEELRDILHASGLPFDRLEIEITESIMIDSAEKARNCIEELHRMGIKIAIDDFGTGYSSLSYLYTFPANLLKIDKSFIDKINSNDPSKQYVAAIISIGHIMGYDVISEGVEEEQQIDALRENGCDYIQGFVWGRPMWPEDAAQLVNG